MYKIIKFVLIGLVFEGNGLFHQNKSSSYQKTKKIVVKLKN